MSPHAADRSLPFLPVLVAGAPRSGTHFLHALICTSASTNPFVPEYHYLYQLVSAYVQALHMFSVGSDSAFPSTEAFADHHFRHVRETLRLGWQTVGSPAAFSTKHCSLTPHIALLAEHVPDMRFVVIVRDPRDAMASFVRAVRKQSSQPDLVPLPLIEKGIDIFNAYYGHVIAVAAGEAASRLLCVRYEDIVAGKGTDRLRRFLGFPDIDPGRLWQRATFDIGADYKDFHMYSELWGKPLSADNVGRFAEVLPHDVAERVSERTAMIAQLVGTLTGNFDD
jgi:hypothetical protein